MAYQHSDFEHIVSDDLVILVDRQGKSAVVAIPAQLGIMGMLCFVILYIAGIAADLEQFRRCLKGICFRLGRRASEPFRVNGTGEFICEFLVQMYGGAIR